MSLGLTQSQHTKPQLRPVCLAVWVGLAVSLGFDGDQPVGFVLEKKGEWLMEGAPARPISEGDRLPAGAKIRPKDGQQIGKNHSLTICLYTGQAKVFTEPSILPVKYDPSLVNRLWRAISGRYSGGYVHAMSRGSELSDGVVCQSNQIIDLSGVFHPNVAGEYQLQFTPLPGNAAKRSGPVMLRLDCPKKTPAPVRSDTLRPGIYQCTIIGPDHQPRDESKAWIMISGSHDYDRAATMYREAVRPERKVG